LTTGSPERRPRGRPLSQRAHRAALRAALEIIGGTGLSDLTIEAVAERAGISRSTFYRHWATKEILIAEALSTLNAGVTLSTSGATRADLIRVARQIVESGLASPLGPGLARVIGEAVYDPRYKDLVWNQFIAPRRAAIAKIFEEGQQRGDLRPDLDIELIMDIVAGTVHYILRANPTPRELTNAPEQIINVIWRGIAAR
jgi:AcrR family transcriptional regulator